MGAPMVSSMMPYMSGPADGSKPATGLDLLTTIAAQQQYAGSHSGSPVPTTPHQSRPAFRC